jgi:hypothetical protein
MTTTEREFYFNPETLEAFKYETMTARYKFIRHECEWGDEEDFRAVLKDFERQIEELEIKELHDMLDHWDKADLVIQLRQAWRQKNIFEQQLLDLRRPKKY